MRTGLVRRYGERDTVPGYIDVVVKHHRCSREVRDTAFKMYDHIAKNTTFNGLSPSMLAMTLVNLAAIKNFQNIPSSSWSGDDTCSYNTLLKHSKKLRTVLEKLDEFSNLKNSKIGR
jgi:hypothetical protein